MTQEELYDLIEAYLNGSLSAEERQFFEARLREDSSLRKEFDLHKQLHSELGDSDISLFRQIVEEENAQIKAPAKVRTLGRLQVLSIAASFALLITAGYFLFSRSGPTASELYSKYYSVPNLSISEGTLRGDDNASLDSIAAIINLANDRAAEGSFDEAIQMTEPLLGNTSAIDQLILLRHGIWHLSNNNPSAALAGLNQVTNQQEAVQWYMAMAYLQLNQLESIPELLQPLVDDPNPRQQEATALLKSIQKLRRN